MRPQGAAEHQTLGSLLPSDSIMARDSLWINRVLRGKGKGDQDKRTKFEPPWDLGRPVPREQEKDGFSWVQGSRKRRAGTN